MRPRPAHAATPAHRRPEVWWVLAGVLAVHALLLMETPFGRSERERPVAPAAPPTTVRTMLVDASRPTWPPAQAPE